MLHIQGEDLITTIQDQGLGIAKEEIPGLFKKFRRVDHSDYRTIGGTGLGLSICKEIIEYHNGHVWIESEEGEGTRVNFTIPLIKEEVYKTLNPPLSCNGQKVIIIEDDTSIAMLLSDALGADGFTVIHHHDQDMAYDDILQIGPVAVVVDLMLNNQADGWDIIKRLRENQKTRNLPIIISSALDENKEKLTMYEINNYLTKPYEPQVLSRILQGIVNDLI